MHFAVAQLRSNLGNPSHILGLCLEFRPVMHCDRNRRVPVVCLVDYLGIDC